jgi:hypothetical protein
MFSEWRTDGRTQTMYTQSVFVKITSEYMGMRWGSWLRHCATRREIDVSIPDGFIGMFHDIILPGRPVVLGLTHPRKEMSTRNISWVVKAAGA